MLLHKHASNGSEIKNITEKDNRKNHDDKVRQPDLINDLEGSETDVHFIGINPVTSSEHIINFLGTLNKDPKLIQKFQFHRIDP